MSDPLIAKAYVRISELEVENARLREDAERYRWWRDQWLLGENEFPVELFDGANSPGQVDDAIDRARVR